mmetsp:Transcript_107193/g.309994  ORF Transcript_107193/g.309994 Transcript_107193/m.309994 type:complete len:105 (+) Transcript_107193:1384-1698(+)
MLLQSRLYPGRGVCIIGMRQLDVRSTAGVEWVATCHELLGHSQAHLHVPFLPHRRSKRGARGAVVQGRLAPIPENLQSRPMRRALGRVEAQMAWWSIGCSQSHD